jgi:hypothetical protein
MEGEVTQFLSGTEIPLSKSTFGIPELEAAAQNKDADMERSLDALWRTSMD